MKNLITQTNQLLKKLTSFGQSAKNQPNRELTPSSIRELKPAADSFKCPYCFSASFKKRGLRQKKLEQVQLYQCKDCGKTFTQQISKGKHYPLPAVLQGLSLYHLGYSLEKVSQILKQKFNYDIQPTSISNWIKEFEAYTKFSRMRPYALQKYTPKNMTVFETLAHQQLYQYRFHRAKCELIIREDIKHSRFGPLQEFLELVPSDCPHQYFTNKKVLRASESPLKFSKTQMIVRAKQNYANQLAQFVLQSVKDRRLRHQALQQFMLFNDSVTVAAEVPVYIEKEDLEHLKDQLGFEFYNKEKFEARNTKHETNSNDQKSKIQNKEVSNFDIRISDLPKLITGHIDLLQIRNGQIHILDYKPKAEKVRPIEQLTLYAMALSRLTGLRLFEFKCAWFDEQDYFEFYPLHVLKKPRSKRRRRKVYTMEGVYQINRQTDKITNLRPQTKGPGVAIN